MKPNEVLHDFSLEERQALTALTDASHRLQPEARFVQKTEQKLMTAFAEKEKTMKRFNLFWQILAGTAATAALALGLIWLVRSVVPEPRAPALPLENQVTATSTPTDLPAGTALPTDPTEPPFDYTVADGDTCASIAIAFSVHIQSLIALNNLPANCALTPGQHIKILAPTPIVAQQGAAAPTGTPEPGTYDWHGVKIRLAVALPTALEKTTLYSYSDDPPISITTVQELADRFGIQGSVYHSGAAAPITYIVTDGKQRLEVTSAGRFTYYPDYSLAANEAPVALEVATPTIDAFLKAHGYTFAYQLEVAKGLGAGWFYVVPLTLEGRAVRFNFGMAQRLEVHLAADGQIISLEAFLLDLDSALPVGNFDLISPEEAWQKFLTDAPLGVLQSSHGSADRLSWHHVYPVEQPVTVYGFVNSVPAAASDQPPLITLDGFMATGSTAGMEKLTGNMFVQASGQFYLENEVRKFKVTAWQSLDQAKTLYLSGSLRRDGEQVTLAADGKVYTLRDVPADVTTPLENVNVSGVADGQSLNWQDIYYFPQSNGGGGGSCGGVFAKLNLEGPAVPWPTATPIITPADATGQKIEGVRGMLSISIFQQTDGSQRTEYYLFTPQAQYLLQGQGLEQLNTNQNRPVTIWGTVTGYNEFKSPIVTVERYEIPFPDLKFQIVRGTQKLIDVNGQQVTLLTTEDGKSYIQMMPGGQPVKSLLGVEGDLVEYESLVIPDETFGGYPTMRVFSGSMALNPKNGQSSSMEITADKPSVLPEPQPQSDNTPASTLTIDAIELAYFTPDPRYADGYPEAMSPYLQPVWRIHGHYSDGSEVEVLIQALKPDFLLPEPAYTLQCG
jgi:LysM repeat protein